MNSAAAFFARLRAVVWIEARVLRRDRTALGLILVVPVLQILLFGYALQPTASAVSVALFGVARDRPPVASLERSGAIVVTETATAEEARAAVRTGRTLLAVLVAPGDAGGEVRVIVDDSDPLRTGPVVSLLQTEIWKSVAEAGALIPPVVRIEPLYNPLGRTEWILTPSLSGVVVMISMLMLAALAIVREREQGSWEALLATPVRPLEALLGKAIPYLAIGVLQAAAVVAGSAVLFALPLRGDLLAFFGFVLLFVFAHLAIGLTLSAAARTTLQALQGAVLFYLPSMLLSGFLFPFANMPGWAQALGRAFPLTHYVTVSRGVFLRGESAAFIADHLAPLLFVIALALLAGVRVFRRLG